jgi:hypothetical protein
VHYICTHCLCYALHVVEVNPVILGHPWDRPKVSLFLSIHVFRIGMGVIISQHVIFAKGYNSQVSLYNYM